jgi:hypothetical protein
MLSLTSIPQTDAESYLKDLMNNAEEPLLSFLKSIDLNKEKIRTPKDLLMFLLSDKTRGKFPEDQLYKAIANLLTSKDLPAETIRTNQETYAEKGKLWILWLALGAVIIFFVIYRNRKKKKDK